MRNDLSSARPVRLLTTLGLATLLLTCARAGSAQAQATPQAARAPASEAKPTQVAAAQNKPAASVAALKKPAPDFTLPDLDGKSISLHALRGKVVVLEWFNPDCPFIKFAHTKGPLRELAKQLGSDKLVWLSINSGGVGKQGNGLARNRASTGSRTRSCSMKPARSDTSTARRRPRTCS